mmetsp:Transcript_18886/g.37162  ORF Transcript_18886/g.37162 Transcript_18886/m.37162 type:complete len:638 (-) Transcript_18886:86-1999(-)|eukprot:CAMPEP_0175143544 /NCGR_PEP_ID=MMETSP0087-20121206/13512_1 /TAXON_ID=136419 /ORGANISM="Unknown Unknown, Strain D1" /LENGTH=637 /DNA_ID=CAMNT_0016427667 /DNA_START=32 /DNA_END=1945 /DNA_ORIENTATION=-
MPIQVSSASLSPADLINKPLDVVQLLVDEAPADQITPNSDWGVPAFFQQKLAGTHIPLLNNSISADGSKILPTVGPQPQTLVRFRCMVQETLNSEFFIGCVKCPNGQGQMKTISGKYSESLELSPEDAKFVDHRDASQAASRLVLNCVVIPGESAWLKESLGMSIAPAEGEAKQDATQSARPKKRAHDDQDDTEEDYIMEEEAKTEKQARTEDSGMGASGHSDQPSSAAATVAVPHASNKLLETPSKVQCLVKVYTEDESLFRVGQTYEFLGVFCMPPPETGGSNSGISIEEDGHELMHWPASRVMRVHAIAHRPVSVNDCVCPSAQLQQQEFLQVAAAVQRDLSSTRSSLVHYLASVCGGDAVCAELLLANLLSSVHSRQHGKAVGKFALNICLPPSEDPAAQQLHRSFARALSSVYEMLLPRVQSFKLDVPGLNASKLYPVKDYDFNCLLPARLQMGEGTAVVIDEVDMSSGNLDDTGCRNLRAISRITSEQLLEYDFKFHTMDFPVDHPVLLISRGASIVPSDARYSLTAANLCSVPLPSDELAHKWRVYLSVARQISVDISDDAAAMVSSSFVALRQQNPKTNENQLHLRLTLAKLLSASHMESNLSQSAWELSLSVAAKLSQPGAEPAIQVA